MKQTRKFFNLRLFFIGFVGMIFGILTFFNYLNIIWLNKFSFWFVGLCLIFAGSVVLLIVSIVKVNLRNYIKYLAIYIFLFIVGFSIFGLKINQLTSLKEYDGNCVVEGIVDNYYHANNLVLIIDNVKINNEKVNSKVTLYVIEDIGVKDNLTLGDKVKVNCELTLSSLITNKINIGYFVDNNVYSGYVMNSDLKEKVSKLIITKEDIFVI